MFEKWDVVIIGAGPAGALAALNMAYSGAKVLMIDRKSKIGVLPQCAEFVPNNLELQFKIPVRSKVQFIKGMKVKIKGENSIVINSPGWILDRQLFDYELVLAAIKAGTVLRMNSNLVGFSNGRLLIRHGYDLIEIIAGCILAADGATSTTSKLLGLLEQDLLLGIQVEVSLLKMLEYNRIFLDPKYLGGYAWLFPKGSTANLGIGCTDKVDSFYLLSELRNFLIKKGFIGSSILAFSKGLIPIGGLRRIPLLNMNNFFLLGDAAGLVHPITGSGVPQAVNSGLMAGEFGLKFLGGKNEAMQDYWHDLFIFYGGYLSRGLNSRKRMMLGWNSVEFKQLMNEVWPGLKSIDKNN